MRNPKVTTDRTVDCSSLDPIIADVVRPGMSDEGKVGALCGVAADGLPLWLMPAQASRNGRVVFGVRLPYMVSTATSRVDSTRRTGSDRVHGWARPAEGAWRLVWEEPHCGRRRRELDLSPWVLASYGYDVHVGLKARRSPGNAVLHALVLETRFLLNYPALPRLLPGRNGVRVEVANSAEPRDQQPEIAYAWVDREGEHEDRRTVTSSPFTYTVHVARVPTEPAENPKHM